MYSRISHAIAAKFLSADRFHKIAAHTHWIASVLDQKV